MGNIIQFQRPKEIEYPTMPTPEEIAVMLIACEKSKDDELDYVINNGKYWAEVFNRCMEYAKEIEMNPWDVLATIINRMCGIRFYLDENGNGGVEII